MSETKYFYYNSKGERVRKKEISVEEYAKAKIKFLTKDFRLVLTPKEINGMLFAKSEISVDNWARDVFNRCLKSSA